MKKSKILLLASVALLLTSCGTKYTLKGDDDNVLTLGGSSFTIVNEGDDIITTTKGKVEELEEGKYELTVTSESYKLEKGEPLSKVEEALLGLTWSTEDIEKLKDGKTVTHKLEEEDYYTVKISVDTEAKTYQVVLF